MSGANARSPRLGVWLVSFWVLRQFSANTVCWDRPGIHRRTGRGGEPMSHRAALGGREHRRHGPSQMNNSDSLLPNPVKHKVIHDQLASARKEIKECLLAIWSLEYIILFNLRPG